jgi:hypothetical protein
VVELSLRLSNTNFNSLTIFRTFSRNDVGKFLLEAADQGWILQKVVLMMGIFGGCRDELCKMMNCYGYYRYVIIFNIEILFHIMRERK